MQLTMKEQNIENYLVWTFTCKNHDEITALLTPNSAVSSK